MSQEALRVDGVQIISDGRITIPAFVRDRAGLVARQHVDVTVESDGTSREITRVMDGKGRIDLHDDVEADLGVEPGDPISLEVPIR